MDHTGEYQFKPLKTEAARVTRENILEITAWVNGYHYFGSSKRFYIHRSLLTGGLEILEGEWGDWLALTRPHKFETFSLAEFQMTFEPVMEEEHETNTIFDGFNNEMTTYDTQVVLPPYDR